MKYTKWDNNLITKQINDLEALQIFDNRAELFFQVEMLKTLIDDTTPLFPVSRFFHEQINDDLKAIHLHSEFINDIKYFSELKNLFDFSGNYAMTKYDLKESVVLSFIHDFYQKIDKDFAKLFNKVFKERKHNLKFSDSRSFSVYINELKYSYINIERQETIDDFVDGVHEYAHSIADLICPRYNYDSSYPFIELLPIFMQLLSYDELINTFVDFEKDVTISKSVSLYQILNYTQCITLEIKFLSQIETIKHKRETVKDLSNFANMSIRKANKIFDTSITERLAYVIPSLTVIEFYYIYLKDPEYCIYLLKKILSMDEVLDYNDYLAKNGIIINDNSEKYVLEAKKQLKKMNLI